jgi:hypothetical protein
MQTVLKMGKLLSKDAQKKIKGGLFGSCDCDPLGPCPGPYYCCVGTSSNNVCRRVANYDAAVQWVASQTDSAWCVPFSSLFC